MEYVPLQNRVDMCFQQDGASPYFDVNEREYLNNEFANQ